jgi:hypothetical protein
LRQINADGDITVPSYILDGQVHFLKCKVFRNGEGIVVDPVGCCGSQQQKAADSEDAMQTD